MNTMNETFGLIEGEYLSDKVEQVDEILAHAPWIALAVVTEAQRREICFSCRLSDTVEDAPFWSSGEIVDIEGIKQYLIDLKEGKYCASHDPFVDLHSYIAIEALVQFADLPESEHEYELALIQATDDQISACLDFATVMIVAEIGRTINDRFEEFQII